MNKQNKKEPKNTAVDDKKITDEEAETNVTTTYKTDKDFHLEIEEYAKKLKKILMKIRQYNL